MKIYYKIFTIILATTSLSVMAKTPRPIGEVVSKSADLVFKSPGEISISITTSKDLKAGKFTDKTRVADYRIISSMGSWSGVRFTPGTGEIDNITKIKIMGKNDSKHKLSLLLEPLDAHIKANDWIISRDEKHFFDGRININGDQIVQSDIYTVSIDASNFTS
ncbi:hypothetical protein QNA27_18370 [Pantoea eucalypti]|uniref:hypothetical protein n=1 Tax=Pantoea eucalypti TaxID=470933 RepID=UPI0024B93129|nr:hypothetical protein [Pantoea eucalypti]MDJ0475626.1 hypothetical protein [Pantoea eucalypti]